MQPLHGVRVLVVDDDPDTLEVTRVLLQAAGATVLGVDTAAKALAAVKGERPDVVLCDIAMPEHDGYWLLRRVRALPPAEGGETPMAALTAHASAATRREVLAAGFQAHLTKPTDPEELVREVRRFRP